MAQHLLRVFHQSRLWGQTSQPFFRGRSEWITQDGSHDKTLLLLNAIPAAIAFFVLCLRIFQRLCYRPIWTRPFVVEQRNVLEVPVVVPKSRHLRSGDALLGLCIIGLVFEVVIVSIPPCNMKNALPITAWAVINLLLCIDRPQTAPLEALSLLIGLLATQLISLIYIRSVRPFRDIGIALEATIAALSIAVILHMPLRSPELPRDGISPAYKRPTQQLRSPEDNLRLWQYMTVSWMSPLISVGSSRQLNDEDVWSLGHEFQHRILHNKFRELTGSVVKRLLVANGLDLVILSFLGILESASNFAAPVLLQQLLQSMEDFRAPKSHAVTFAVLSLLVRLIACQSSVFSLWYGRRCYERSRGEMIMMLYEKTLSRKIVGDSKKSQDLDEATLDAKDHLQSTKSHEKRRFPILGKAVDYLKDKLKSRRSIEDPKQPASVGKIFNLMRNDVYEVAQRFWEFQSLVTKPLNLILAIVLTWKLIGWPCLIGVLTVVVAQIVNVFITRALLRNEMKRRTATDTKLKKITQFVGAIRHLRWYGWQEFWQEQIMQARQHELNLRIVTGLWVIAIGFTITLASGMFPVAAFYAYTVLAGEPLRIDIAFPALQLFTMLENSLREIPGLIVVLLNANVAVGRIESFMNEDNKEDSIMKLIPKKTPEIILRDASFAWPGTSHMVLYDVSLTLSLGLNLVYGKVAAGKTALLQAILGELDKTKGTVSTSNEMIGYCAQTPWLQSMSIRENILFSFPYEEARYRNVLEACALTQDLADFKHGDLSNIGENGIGLSGGQRARVALARAVYSPARILLLDDPISALDLQTAETIIRKCLGGPLMEGRMIVLVTHRPEVCYAMANKIVEVSDGRTRTVAKEAMALVGLNNLSETQSLHSADSESREREEQINVLTSPDKFIEDEHRAHGDVRASVYWEYIKAGKLRLWAVLILLLALFRLIAVGETWFLKKWGEAYDQPSERFAPTVFPNLPSPSVNIKPWLIGFFVLAVAQASAFLISQCFMLVIIYSAGRQMFKNIMNRVSHATFRFYDVTPLGRLMNRMTSDIGTVDGNISQQFQDVAFLAIKWIMSVVVIASVTPIFLVFSFALTAGFIAIFLKFLPTSQSLRRLEMVSLSPLMSNFGALLDGLTTVRAFRAQTQFQDRVIAVTDAFQKMDHFYWSLQAWLMYRFDALSALSTFVLTLLALYTSVSPGLTAFVLTAASEFVTSTHSLCKRYGKLQMDFVSVERVVEMLHLEQEPPGSVDPPAWWPSCTRDILFEDVTIRYAPHLEPSLKGISFRIPSGSTTALLGRTGSGKSTLALSLLAIMAPETGRILIDNIDISTVNTQTLRNRITFLPQDPTLLPGSLAENLDPLSEHSPTELSAILARIAPESYGWTLNTQIEEGGKNLSQGQRQLVAVCRAVVRRSAVVIMDEATASIDAETARSVQTILREELKGSTVLTIAHRVEAVQGADFFVRLEGGRVVETGPVGR